MMKDGRILPSLAFKGCSRSFSHSLLSKDGIGGKGGRRGANISSHELLKTGVYLFF
jgi:hypothetical protein